jgi:gluconolactonase
MAESQPDAFKIHDPAFRDILGPTPKLYCILTYASAPLAHEAGVFIPANNELFVTSNRFLDPFTDRKQIQISRVKTSHGQCSSEVIETGSVPMANGGVNYENGILFCAQGTLLTPGGIAFMEASPPYHSHFLVQDFYGRPFNSPNDVVVHSDGSIWFTDPIYGFEQGIRPPPVLPSQIYRFNPKTKGCRAMADGFGRPNGICFDPEERVVYITDTDFIHGDGSADLTRASSM